MSGEVLSIHDSPARLINLPRHENEQFLALNRQNIIVAPSCLIEL
jgi:hypothetical protein